MITMIWRQRRQIGCPNGTRTLTGFGKSLIMATLDNSRMTSMGVLFLKIFVTTSGAFNTTTDRRETVPWRWRHNLPVGYQLRAGTA